MNVNIEANERPNKRAKVDIACNTCRQRKSRCDGNKPICSLCESLSLICIYRHPVESGRSEDVLRRLASAEARLQTLENTSSAAISCESIQRNDETVRARCVPQLHTAGAHKILHSWPRLRVKFTHATIEPLQYLANADSADSSLMQPRIPIHLDPKALRTALDRLLDNLTDLPAAVATLLQSSGFRLGPSTWMDAVVSDDPVWQQDIAYMVSQPTSLLLMVVVAEGFLGPDQSFAQPRQQLPQVHDLFAAVLQRSWQLYNRQPAEQIPYFLMIAYIEVYLFSRPFHAIGLLRYVSSFWNQPFILDSDPSFRTYARLHFLLESDIFSEIDGVPTTQERLLPYHVLPCSGAEDSAMRLLDFHTRLRLLENEILFDLYPPSKAYVHPDQIGQTISSLSRDLEHFYRSLPLDLQFSRNILGQGGEDQQHFSLIELAQRYFACEFLLNRPVFYFVLHEDMEQSASPAEVMASYQGIRPWMKDACYTTVRSAVMLLNLRIIPRKHNNWCDNQLLLACYLITLQARLRPDLSGLHRQFRDSDIEALLDTADNTLETAPLHAVVDRWTLEMMRNVRQNVNASLHNQSSPT